jgi:hypothetical protein
MASVASKKAKKKEKAKSKSKERLSLSELKTLGHELLSSRAHINNLPILLSYVSPTSPPPLALESLLSLHSFFAPILSDLPSSSSKPPSTTNHDDPDFIYNTWLRSKFDLFVNSLIDFAASPFSDETLKVCFFFPISLNCLFILFCLCVCLIWVLMRIGGCVGYDNGVREGRKWWEVSLCYISQASTCYCKFCCTIS